MHPYLPVLVDDIKAAHRNQADIPLEMIYPMYEEAMKEMKGFASSEEEKPLSYFTGLQIENFPPQELFSEEDMKIALDAFDEMLESWNAGIDYPKNMPVKNKYEFLRNHVLESGFTPMNSGSVHFDFCTGDAPECEWEEYCTCLKFGKEPENKNDGLDEITAADLPI